MNAIQIADSFDSFAIDHTPDGWPAVQQKQLTEAAAELRRLEAQLQKETAARQAAQIEAEALKERLVRADAEKCAAVLAERIAPNAPVQEPVAKYIGEGPEGSLVQLYDDVSKGTELYTAQPSKAVKLTDDEIKDAVRPLWPLPAHLDRVLSMYGDEYRAIEQAVWAKLGVTE